MAKAEENGSRDSQRKIPGPISNLPRDLLQRLASPSPRLRNGEQEEETDSEIELSLGLSLNGRFGTDPRSKINKLTRSSSIPDVMTHPLTRKIENGVSPANLNSLSLTRTCSLPAETEEEWRKRKELQSLRRQEAKRKRFEKQKGMRAMREVHRSLRDEAHRENGKRAETGVKDGDGSNGFTEGGDKVSGLCSNGGSQGSSGSSGISELENHSVQGIQPIPRPDQSSSISPGSEGPARTQNQNQSQRINERPPVAGTVARAMLEDMPCVSTRGDGPNGRRVEGFLYRYRKGEEVRIVCVCHGSFLSPAEFVKHAGGGDVAHPMRHIVVNPASSFL